MKKGLLTIAVAVATVGIVSCSTNTQKQNETVGAVSGAVIGGVAGSFIGQGTGQIVAAGVGALVGALVGYEVGKNMDSIDCKNTFVALNDNPKGKATRWKNKKTGAMYTVVPTSKPMQVGSNDYCRSYRATSIMNGEKHTMTGTACRQSDGTWKNINS